MRTFSRLSPSKYPVAYKLGFLWHGRSANYIITILQTANYIIFRKPREIVQSLIAYTLFLFSTAFVYIFPWMQIAMIDRGKPSLENPPLLQWESLHATTCTPSEKHQYYGPTDISTLGLLHPPKHQLKGNHLGGSRCTPL